MDLVRKLSYEDDHDVLSLYRRLVTSWVQRHKSLDIICFAHLFNSQQPGNMKYDDSLPSWVPVMLLDWRVFWIGLAWILFGWSGSGASKIWSGLDRFAPGSWSSNSLTRLGRGQTRLGKD